MGELSNEPTRTEEITQRGTRKYVQVYQKRFCVNLERQMQKGRKEGRRKEGIIKKESKKGRKKRKKERK